MLSFLEIINFTLNLQKLFFLILDSSTSTDNDPNKDKSKTPKSKDLHLPISRVRTIMKSTPDIENIGLPSLHVVTKATVI